MSAARIALVALGCAPCTREARPVAPPAPVSATAAEQPSVPERPPSFVDPDGRYAVDFHATPRIDHSQQRVDAESTIFQQSAVVDADPKRLFQVITNRLTAVEQYDCARGLDGMRTSIARDLGCTAVGEAAIDVGGRPGRKLGLVCDDPSKRKLRARLRLVCDDREVASQHQAVAFSILAAYEPDVWNEAEAQAFVRSFRLLR